MSNFLLDLALAHKRKEGYAPGTPSWVNNNPGNLRLLPYQVAVYGAAVGYEGFTHFPSYAVGLQALEDDLRAKIMGHSTHINYAANPTFLDYVKVYAPTGDGNDPVKYANDLISFLPQYHLTLTTPLSQLAQWINPPPIDPAAVDPNIAYRRDVRLAAQSPEPLHSRILRAIRILFPNRP